MILPILCVRNNTYFYAPNFGKVEGAYDIALGLSVCASVSPCVRASVRYKIKIGF